MSPFQSLFEYERFIYTLQQRHASLLQSTLTVARRSRGIATLVGELHFAHGYRLVVSEVLTWDEGRLLIQRYGYEVWRGGEKLYWYDPQPHPNEPTLAETHPHHKHIPPDIKHHRIPAPDMSFNGPNLPRLIEEVEHLILTENSAD